MLAASRPSLKCAGIPSSGDGYNSGRTSCGTIFQPVISQIGKTYRGGITDLENHWFTACGEIPKAFAIAR
nr:MAG TPA: hypothetical protein [Caudoviricetes sp.]